MRVCVRDDWGGRERKRKREREREREKERERKRERQTDRQTEIPAGKVVKSVNRVSNKGSRLKINSKFKKKTFL